MENVRSKMKELRLNCEQEIQIRQQKSDSFFNSFHKHLQSARSTAQIIVLNQAKLENLKLQLRAVEDDLVKALAVKTRKEAKRMAVMDSAAATKARVDELSRVVEEQKARRDEYTEIISQQSQVLSACEEKCEKDSECRGEVEEAISWYNRILGFRIECGHGIKFIFTNMNSQNPKEEYSFTIRHENDVYSLLDCYPNVSGAKELITQLNKSNGLFQFVRTMREKFQEIAICGTNPQFVSVDQETSLITASAPVLSVSTDSRIQSPPAKQKAHQAGDTDRLPKKVNHGGSSVPDIMSPGGSSVRRSVRLKVRK